MTLQNIFEYVVCTSVYGSIVGIVLLVLKSALMRKMPAKWQYLLWMVLILKLIFPTGPESRVSIFNLLSPPAAVTENISVNIRNLPQATVGISGYEPSSAAGISAAGVLPFIWIAGAAGIALFIISSNLFFRVKLVKNTLPTPERVSRIFAGCRGMMGISRKIELVTQNCIASPSLFGILSPKILLPEDFEKMNDRYIEYTMIHELAHYKRKDIYINYLLLVLSCIHWFNPCLWYCFKKIRLDMESAADEKTMTYLSSSEYKDYGFALIAAVEGFKKMRFSAGTLGMANDGGNIKKRIKVISGYKKPKIARSVAAVIVAGAAAAVCLSSAYVPKVPVLQGTQINFAREEHQTEVKYEEEIYEETEMIPVYMAETAISGEEPVDVTETEDKTSSAKIQSDVEFYEYTKEGNISADESVGPLDITQVIGFSGNKPSYASVVDLEQFYKVIDYNFDRDITYTASVYPDSRGNIGIYFDSEFSAIAVKITVREQETGKTYTYSVPGNKQIMYYLYTYDPGKIYDVSIYGYCPGGYNISGKILIY